MRSEMLADEPMLYYEQQLSNSLRMFNKRLYTKSTGEKRRKRTTPHLVKIGCELPEKLDRSLSHWDCYLELARKRVDDGRVEDFFDNPGKPIYGVCRGLLCHARLI